MGRSQVNADVLSSGPNYEESRWRKSTKQVATVGPASNTLEMLEKLFLAGQSDSHPHSLLPLVPPPSSPLDFRSDSSNLVDNPADRILSEIHFVHLCCLPPPSSSRCGCFPSQLQPWSSRGESRAGELLQLSFHKFLDLHAPRRLLFLCMRLGGPHPAKPHGRRCGCCALWSRSTESLSAFSRTCRARSIAWACSRTRPRRELVA